MKKDLGDKEKSKKYWEDKYWMKRGRGCPAGGGGGNGAIYGLGFIGALIYFIGHATTFWAGVLGFFQALVWPAYVVYELLKFLIG